MSKVAICFNTKDRTEQVKRVVEPLLQPEKFDLWWQDGSVTPSGQELPWKYPEVKRVMTNARGGPDYAAVRAFADMLDAPANYTHVGIIEDDVLLHPDWFGPTMALFGRGAAEGLEVGAVSARAYDDRILIQRDGYALMHNLGYGMIILSREAATCALNHVRTGFTSENRTVFARLCGLDIKDWWAFRDSEHMICADWGLEKFLAMDGYAALALTPSPCEMVGQNPPLHEQGLRLNDHPFELLRNDQAFEVFASRTQDIRTGALDLNCPRHLMPHPNGQLWMFPQHFNRLHAVLQDEWRTKWTFGLGPFSLRAMQTGATLSIPVAGPCSVLVAGADEPARVRVTNTKTKERSEVLIAAEKSQQPMEIAGYASGVQYANIVVEALTPGVTVLALRVLQPQPAFPASFDIDWLPPALELSQRLPERHTQEPLPEGVGSKQREFAPP